MKLAPNMHRFLIFDDQMPKMGTFERCFQWYPIPLNPKKWWLGTWIPGWNTSLEKPVGSPNPGMKPLSFPHAGTQMKSEYLRTPF
jgi:hypothetical protein